MKKKLTTKELEEARRLAYKENPEAAIITDFLMQHENKLYELYGRFVDDTGGAGDTEVTPFLLFVMEVFRSGQELVIDPKKN